MSTIPVLFRNSVYIWVILMFSCNAAGASMPPLSEQIHYLAKAGMRYVYEENFTAAENASKKIIKKFPEHPAGYFLYASVLDARMSLLKSDQQEDEFYQFCDLAISKGEYLLEKEPDNPWARFFVAGANGAKGTYESRLGRWITAFRHGWQGVAEFKRMAEDYPDFSDLYFGIGTYDYWRSAMTKTLWWMPGVEDKRHEAIEMLYEALDKGMLVSDAVAQSLIPILCNEKHYNAALELSEKMLKKYPSSSVFMLGKAQALIGLKQYLQAEKALISILSHMNKKGFLTTHNRVQIRYNLMLCYEGQNKTDELKQQCRLIKEEEIKKEIRKRLESELQNVTHMCEECH